MSTIPAGRRRAGAVLGLVGELLVTAGVLIGLYLVWQLWWTDVAATRTHADVVADLAWEPSAPPVDDAPVAPPPAMVEPGHGETFATLTVPRWDPGHAMPISQGVTRDVIDVLGVGHYPGTAMPGQVGNFALAAHRVTYGRLFHHVEELEPGDELVVQTAAGWFVYRVTGFEVVLPAQTEVIAPVPGRPGEVPDRATITLTTCHPKWSARERFIVHGELDRWVPADDGGGDDATGDDGDPADDDVTTGGEA